MRLGLLVEILRHLPVATGLGLELRLSSWVGQGSTIEHKASTIATEVVGIALLEGKAVDSNGER